MTSSEFDPAIAIRAPILGPIFSALVESLADGGRHRRSTVLDAVRARTGCHPHTFSNLIGNLAAFGIVDRPPGHLRLTPLGRRWLADEADRLRCCADLITDSLTTPPPPPNERSDTRA